MLWKLLSLLTCALLLSACASSVQIAPAPKLSPDKASLAAERQSFSWWQLRFRLTWPEDTQPDFSRHLLIAEQIMLPIITEHEDHLSLWRFHRRAGRDNSGHQFSLIFYTDKLTATAIHQQAEEDQLTRWLYSEGMIERVAFSQRSAADMTSLGQTSDPNWPPEVQHSWPYFIMGVSQTWLMLVQELSREQPLEGKASYEELLQHYREVDTQLNTQWRDYGQHAYLHHLNAVFGYQPVKIRSSELKSF